MASYYASSHLAREASTIYEVFADGTFRAISPQGQEHRGSGEIPGGTEEMSRSEALRLISARIATLTQQEARGLPSWGPVTLPREGLLDGGVITDEWRAREEWRNNGWGTGEPNDPPRLRDRLSRLLRTLRGCWYSKGT